MSFGSLKISRAIWASSFPGEELGWLRDDGWMSAGDWVPKANHSHGFGACCNRLSWVIVPVKYHRLAVRAVTAVTSLSLPRKWMQL